MVKAVVPPRVRPPSATVVPLPLIPPPVQVVAPVTVSVPEPLRVPPVITNVATEEVPSMASVPPASVSEALEFAVVPIVRLPPESVIGSWLVRLLTKSELDAL